MNCAFLIFLVMLTVAHMAHHRLTTVARHPSVACPVSSAHQAIGWPGELPWCLLWITELSYSKCFSIAFCSSKIESKSSRACTSSVCSCLSCWQILFILSINLISIQWLDSPFTKSLGQSLCSCFSLYPCEYSFHPSTPSRTCTQLLPWWSLTPPQHCL